MDSVDNANNKLCNNSSFFTVDDVELLALLALSVLVVVASSLSVVLTGEKTYSGIVSDPTRLVIYSFFLYSAHHVSSFSSLGGIIPIVIVCSL